MDNGTLVAAAHHLGCRRPGLRRASVLAALAIVLSMFVLVQQPADAAPKAAAGVAAQTDFRQLICPILLEIRDEFDDEPFFAIVVPIIDQLLVAFGCTGAPTTTTTVAPTTTTTTIPPTTTTTVRPFPTIPGGSFAQLACPTLLAIRNSFASSPFFSAFVPFLDQVIASFGCPPISG